MTHEKEINWRTAQTGNGYFIVIATAYGTQNFILVQSKWFGQTLYFYVMFGSEKQTDNDDRAVDTAFSKELNYWSVSSWPS